MFSKNQTNIQRVLICGNVPVSSGIVAGNKIGAGVAGTGEVVITSPSGTIIDASNIASFSKVKFTQERGTGKVPNMSDVIDLAKVKRVSASPYTADTEDSVVIGYNPATSAGAIDVLNLNTYYLRVYDKADSRLGFAQQGITQAHMVSDTTATQAEIAIKLVANLTANSDKKADRKLLVECVGDTTGGTNGAALGDVTFTNGSNVMTHTTNNVVVGEYIEDSNNVVYQVKSFVGTTVFLDRPYTGATNTMAAYALNHIVTTSTVPFGVRITGTPNSFRVGNEHFRKTRFEVQLKDFGSTPVTKLSSASEGFGKQEQVEELELWASGHNFNYYRKDFQYRREALDSTSLASSVNSNKWSVLTIEYDELTTGGIGPKSVSPKVLTICLQLANSGTAGTGSVANASGKSGEILIDALNVAGVFPNAEFNTNAGAAVVIGTDV